jgi:alpha-galactosidase/6-phospho-beta-glucosidase family protein
MTENAAQLIIEVTETTELPLQAYIDGQRQVAFPAVLASKHIARQLEGICMLVRDLKRARNYFSELALRLEDANNSGSRYSQRACDDDARLLGACQ